MERVELPETNIKQDYMSPPSSPNAMHIQSLLHAVSNKEKVREDMDDVSFLKEVNRSRSRKKTSPVKSEKMSPINIFSHLKNLSDKIESEDQHRSKSPSQKREYRTPSPRKKMTPKVTPKRMSIHTPPASEKARSERVRTPTPSKNHIEEKACLLQTFFLLQQQGVKSDLKLDITSDINIIKSEVLRMQTELNSSKMIKFMRKGLIAFVSGLEFLNNRYDPCGLQLNGFSEHCMTSLGDYDGVFMRLYDKYKDRTAQLAPEVELLLLLLGSMMMFHLTQQFVQQSMPKSFMHRETPAARTQQDSDDDDMESVATENFIPASSGDNQFMPTDVLSTPAFPAMIQKLVSDQPRPKFAPPKKLEPVIEEVKEVNIDVSNKPLPKSKGTKDEQVLVLG